MSNYSNKFIEFRKSLSKKDYFLDEQSAAWSAADRFVEHHFSNTIVFFSLFLLGGLSTFLFTIHSGETLWDGCARVLAVSLIALCVYLVSRFRKHMGSVIFHAYIIDEVTRRICLEEIARYEYELYSELNSLTHRIKYDTNMLNQCDPNDVEKIHHLSNDLVEFSETLQNIHRELYALHNLRDEYLRGSLYDFDITTAVIEHHK